MEIFQFVSLPANSASFKMSSDFIFCNSFFIFCNDLGMILKNAVVCSLFLMGTTSNFSIVSRFGINLGLDFLQSLYLVDCVHVLH